MRKESSGKQPACVAADAAAQTQVLSAGVSNDLVPMAKPPPGVQRKGRGKFHTITGVGAGVRARANGSDDGGRPDYDRRVPPLKQWRDVGDGVTSPPTRVGIKYSSEGRDDGKAAPAAAKERSNQKSNGPRTRSAQLSLVRSGETGGAPPPVAPPQRHHPGGLLLLPAGVSTAGASIASMRRGKDDATRARNIPTGDRSSVDVRRPCRERSFSEYSSYAAPEQERSGPLQSGNAITVEGYERQCITAQRKIATLARALRIAGDGAGDLTSLRQEQSKLRTLSVAAL